MGTFSIPIGIGDQECERWTTLDALVDTGASIISVPASVLRDLGVAPITQQRFQFGQGEVRRMDVGQTWIRIEGREVVTLVLFNEERTLPQLGALADVWPGLTIGTRRPLLQTVCLPEQRQRVSAIDPVAAADS